MQIKASDILKSAEHFYIELGLDRIEKVLKLLNNPQNRLKCIHVAGTNGKGSVCQMLNQILIDNGFKVGLYTSPHIFKYNERIKINGININDFELDNLVKNICNISKENSINLTEFEILTAAAFVYFEKNSVDYVVLETGLGGRFDATNVIKKNILSIITHIDLEHTERLGDTIEKISFEKAGIIKENCPVVIGEKNNVIEDVSKNKNAKIYYAEPSSKKCSLKGLHQKFNLGLVIKACEILNLKVRDEVLLNIKNPLRYEYLEEYNLLVDVSHNPNSIEALRNTLDENYPNQNFDFIFNCLSTKDYKKMLKLLLKADDRLYIYEFNNPKACKIKDFKGIINNKILEFKEYKKSDRLTVICGSFYMLKELFNAMGIKYNMDSQLS